MINNETLNITNGNEALNITDGIELKWVTNNITDEINTVHVSINDFKNMLLTDNLPELINEIKDIDLVKKLLISNIYLYTYLENKSILNIEEIMENVIIKDNLTSTAYIKFFNDYSDVLNSETKIKYIYEIIGFIKDYENEFSTINVEIFTSSTSVSNLKYNKDNNTVNIEINLFHFIEHSDINNLINIRDDKIFIIMNKYCDETSFIHLFSFWHNKYKDHKTVNFIPFFLFISKINMYSVNGIKHAIPYISANEQNLSFLSNDLIPDHFKALLCFELLQFKMYNTHLAKIIEYKLSEPSLKIVCANLKDNLYRTAILLEVLDSKEGNKSLYSLICHTDRYNLKTLQSTWSKIKNLIARWLIS